VLPRQGAAPPVGARAPLLRQLRDQGARVLALGLPTALRRGPVGRGPALGLEALAALVELGQEVARPGVRAAHLPARTLLAASGSRQGPLPRRKLALGSELQRPRDLLALVADEDVEALATAAAGAALEAEAALDDAVATQLPDLPGADEPGRHPDRHAEAVLLHVEVGWAAAQLGPRRGARDEDQKLLVCVAKQRAGQARGGGPSL
jgi:hypothetical protein